MSDLYKVRLLDGTIAKIEDCARNIEIVEVMAFPDGYKSLYAELEGCVNLEKIPPIPDTVTDCDCMLSRCTKFNQQIEIPSHVLTVNHMLQGCTSFNQPIKLHNGITRCNSMLRNCTSFNSELEIPCDVLDYDNIVKGCISLDDSKIKCASDRVLRKVIRELQSRDFEEEGQAHGRGYIVRLKNGEYVEVWGIENRDDIDAIIVKPGEY